MSRSIDDGSGIIEGVPLRGPPPLTAGSQLSQQTKSRSLDTGMAMKHEEAANADSELVGWTFLFDAISRNLIPISLVCTTEFRRIF